jgi:hypothetical protein
MRRVRYRVAASLDGYIAGPNGEIDWIVHDPSMDFASLYASIDTVSARAPHVRADATAGRPCLAGGLACLCVLADAPGERASRSHGRQH